MIRRLKEDDAVNKPKRRFGKKQTYYDGTYFVQVQEVFEDADMGIIRYYRAGIYDKNRHILQRYDHIYRCKTDDEAYAKALDIFKIDEDEG